MLKEPLSLPQIIQLLERTRDILVQTEGAWPDALEREFGPSVFPESVVIEELLHASTHETASNLAFAIADIHTLIARIRLREKYKVLPASEFEHVVSSGWSTPLVGELHKKMPEFVLSNLSNLVKSLCSEWGSLPKIMCSMAVNLHTNAGPAP